MYKTARFFGEKIPSFLAVLTAIFFIVQLFNGGNYTEEWALPFISMAMYIFMAYLKGNKPLNIARLGLLSLTFVLTFMIRPNMIAVWAGFGIALLIKWIVEKKYKELIRNLSVILLFVLLFLLPFFLYFYFKGALSDFIYLVFKFNMFEYEPTSVSFTLKRSIKILAGLYYLSVIPFTIVIYMFLHNKTIINGSVLLAFAFTAMVCSLGRLYEHYFMIFAPLLVVPYSFIYAVIKNSFPKVKYALLFIIFIFYNYIPTILQAQYVVENYLGKRFATFVLPPETRGTLKNVIIQNTKPEDKILVNGYQTSVYLYSGRTCATRFPYTLNRSSLAVKYYSKDAEDSLPKLILTGSIMSPLDADGFKLDTLLNNKYQLLPTDIEDVEIWKLKE